MRASFKQNVNKYIKNILRNNAFLAADSQVNNLPHWQSTGYNFVSELLYALLHYTTISIFRRYCCIICNITFSFSTTDSPVLVYFALMRSKLEFILVDWILRCAIPVECFLPTQHLTNRKDPQPATYKPIYAIDIPPNLA